MALADTANLIVSLRLDDKFSGPLGRAQGTLNRFGVGASQTAKGVGQLAVGLGRVGVVAAGAAAAGLVTVARLAGNFEAQLNTINTIAKLNEQDLRQVGLGIRDTFRATGQPLNDLTAGYYDLLSAGIKVADAQRVLNQAVQLGIGGLGTTEQSVDLLTTAINAYGLDAAGAAKASDTFAAAVRDGKVTIADMASEFAVVAPLASTLGVSIEEIGGTLGFMTAKGNTAGETLTDMRSALVALQRQTPEMKQVLHELGIENINTEIRSKGLQGTWEELRAEADRLGIPIIKLTGRVEAMNYVLSTTGPNSRGFQREMERIRDSAGETTAQFEERQKGLNYQLGRLKALAQDAGITIGNALLPKLVPLVERLNEFIAKNQDKIAKFGEDLAEGFGKFADKVSDTDFTNFVNGLQTIASVGGKVVELFLKLPSGIQALIIGGAAINRISGGLVGAGVGNILGGTIKLLFERGSSPANPLWVAPVGGGLGGGAPAAGGPRGIAGAALKFGVIAVGAITAERIIAETQTGFTNARTVAAGGIPTGVNAANVGPTVQLNRGLFRAIGLLAQDLRAGIDIKSALARQPKELQAGIAAAIVNNPLQQRALGLSQEQIRYLDSINGRIDVVGERTRDVGARLQDVKAVFSARLAGIRVEEAATRRNVEAGNRYALSLNGLVRASNSLERGTAQRIAQGNAAHLGALSRVAAIDRDIAGSSRRTAAKDFSPSFSANVYTNITATLSTYNSLVQMARVSAIRTGVANKTGGRVF